MSKKQKLLAQSSFFETQEDLRRDSGVFQGLQVALSSTISSGVGRSGSGAPSLSAGAPQ